MNKSVHRKRDYRIGKRGEPARTAYAADEIAQCDLWFPPVELPVGLGQTRKPTQLPVLTMICAYLRWLSTLLIPSRCAAEVTPRVPVASI